MKQKLKPCPFCGKEAKIFEYYSGDSSTPYFQPGCEEHTLDYCADTKEEAAEIWNTRTQTKICTIEHGGTCPNWYKGICLTSDCPYKKEIEYFTPTKE